PATGRNIVQELEYSEGNFEWYSGYETLNITPPDVISAAEFDWKQGAGTVSINGLESEVQNVGRDAIISLLNARINNAENTMRNNVTVGMYSDGTGSGGKQIGGLQSLVADSPSTGTVGGINRANFSFWRNQAYDATTDGGAAATSSNIQKYMNEVFLLASRGNDKPDLIMADKAYYKLFWESLQAIQRVTSSDKATAGFESLAYANNVPVCYEDSSGISSNHMYFLNTDYLHFRYAPNRLFAPKSPREAINQDASVHMILFAGNLTSSNCSLQGVLKE
ncbi:MAG: phage major capsid protein, partial [Mariprofundaceae bacterium]